MTKWINPGDNGRKLNVHKMLRRRPGPFYNLRPVSKGKYKL